MGSLEDLCRVFFRLFAGPWWDLCKVYGGSLKGLEDLYMVFMGSFKGFD